jgi:ferritin
MYMLSKKTQTALNKQIKMEMDSAYLYMSMSNWSVEQNLNGFASWMMQQYQEEMVHAMKLYKFVQDNGGKVVLEEIDKPKASWKSPREMFEDTLGHEKKVTASIHKLFELAGEEKDYATEVMLHWFINEQVEEEATADEILQKIIMIGEKSTAIWWIDKELGKRGKE